MKCTLPTSKFLPSNPWLYATKAKTPKEETKLDVPQEEEHPTNIPKEENPNIPIEQKLNVPPKLNLLESYEKISFDPAIWLPLPDNNDCFKIAYLYFLQVIMYLGRPQALEEAVAQYLSVHPSPFPLFSILPFVIQTLFFTIRTDTYTFLRRNLDHTGQTLDTHPEPPSFFR